MAEQEMQQELDKLKERQKRGLVRQIENGEVEFDRKRKVFIKVDVDEEIKVDGDDGEDNAQDSDTDEAEDEDKLKNETTSKENIEDHK